MNTNLLLWLLNPQFILIAGTQLLKLLTSEAAKILWLNVLLLWKNLKHLLKKMMKKKEMRPFQKKKKQKKMEKNVWKKMEKNAKKNLLTLMNTKTKKKFSLEKIFLT